MGGERARGSEYVEGKAAWLRSYCGELSVGSKSRGRGASGGLPRYATLGESVGKVKSEGGPCGDQEEGTGGTLGSSS